jgi:type VI secretion system secreted protein Hcp
MAFDAFLKIAGVDGESTDSKHPGEMEIYSFSWGASNPVTIGSASTGVGGGKVSFHSFSFQKKSDKASPTLFQTCAAGDHYDSAIVTLRKAGGTAQVEYLKYTFNIVFVESISWGGSTGGDDSPTESVSMVFGKCQIDYQPQGKDGKPQGGAIHGGWDQTQNVKS